MWCSWCTFVDATWEQIVALVSWVRLLRQMLLELLLLQCMLIAFGFRLSGRLLEIFLGLRSQAVPPIELYHQQQNKILCVCVCWFFENRNFCCPNNRKHRFCTRSGGIQFGRHEYKGDILETFFRGIIYQLFVWDTTVLPCVWFIENRNREKRKKIISKKLYIQTNRNQKKKKSH